MCVWGGGGGGGGGGGAAGRGRIVIHNASISKCESEQPTKSNKTVSVHQTRHPTVVSVLTAISR